MNQKVTLITIAKDLDLTTGTVSRVLNGKAKQFRISEKTVKLVEDYAKMHGYSPNLIAKGLQSSKTYAIGLMIPDIANPFFALLAKYIQRAAAKANYSIILVDSDEDIQKEIVQVNNLLSRKVDGIIAAPVGIASAHFQKITDQNIPLVFVDRYFTNLTIPYITSDNYRGAKIATRLFLKNGHKRIGLIKGNEIIEPAKERKRGYIDALKESGLDIDKELIEGNEFGIENGYTATQKMLELKNCPTALLAMSNLIGLGAMQAIKEKKMNIPDDVSLIIFDDQPYVSYLNPPITTVKQNTEIIGELAFEHILKKITDNTLVLESQIIDSDLVERLSVRNIKTF